MSKTKLKKLMVSVVAVVCLLVSSVPVYAGGTSGSGTHGSWDYDYNCYTSSTNYSGYMNVYPDMTCQIKAWVYFNNGPTIGTTGHGFGRASTAGQTTGIKWVQFEIVFGANVLLADPIVRP